MEEHSVYGQKGNNMKFTEYMSDEKRAETLTEINDTIEGKNNLIVVTQLPIIQEQLAAIKAQFEEAAARAKELECTEENLSEIKKTRANITKVFASLEERRKEAKRAIMGLQVVRYRHLQAV